MDFTPLYEDGLYGRVKDGDLLFGEEYPLIRITKGVNPNECVVEGREYVTLTQMVGQVGG